MRYLAFGMYGSVLSVWLVQFVTATVYIKPISEDATNLSASVDGRDCVIACSNASKFEVDLFRLSN